LFELVEFDSLNQEATPTAANPVFFEGSFDPG